MSIPIYSSRISGNSNWGQGDCLIIYVLSKFLLFDLIENNYRNGTFTNVFKKEVIMEELIYVRRDSKFICISMT